MELFIFFNLLNKAKSVKSNLYLLNRLINYLNNKFVHIQNKYYLLAKLLYYFKI
jgi:hypothetical protein